MRQHKAPRYLSFREIEILAPRRLHRSMARSRSLAWEVFPAAGGALIGLVRWHAPWRKYCFFPQGWTLYDWRCLVELAKFCHRETRKHMMRCAEARRAT